MLCGEHVCSPVLFTGVRILLLPAGSTMHLKMTGSHETLGTSFKGKDIPLCTHAILVICLLHLQEGTCVAEQKALPWLVTTG